jgi:hypothetical protein
MAKPITLKVFRGKDLVRSERFDRDIIKIGRRASAHLVLDDERVSPVHAVIEVAADGAMSIIDMATPSGTFVNGASVSRAALRPGDEIIICGVRMVVDVPSPEAAVAAAPAPAVFAAAPAPAVFAAAPDAAVVAAAPAVSAPAPQPAAEPAPLAAPASAPARRSVRPRRAALRPADRTVEDLTGAEDLGVELRLLWGQTLLDAATFIRPSAPVLVGASPRCAIHVEGLPLGELPMLRWQGGDYQFAFAQGMTGVLEEKGARTGLSDLALSRRAATDEKVRGAYWIPVPRAGAVRADLGARLAIEARPRRPERVKSPPFWERISYQFLNLFLLLFFLGAGFVIVASNYPYDTDVSADDLTKNPSRMTNLIILDGSVPPARPSPAPAAAAETPDQPAAVARHDGDEGASGRPDAPRTHRRSSVRADDPAAAVRRSALIAALGSGRTGTSTVFDSSGLVGDLRSAVGDLAGPIPGDSQGWGGLGVRGRGPGGGGTSPSIGLDRIDTKGPEGFKEFWSRPVDLGRKVDRKPEIAFQGTTVCGDGSPEQCIDRELVRKVIQEHASQIRYCYEQQLALNPRLQGKVAIKWVIQPDGTVTDPQVDRDRTTLDDGKIQQCMASRITSWQFPKPKAGGIAVITYPWILRPSGGME